MIVKTIKSGAATMYIHDDCCVSQEEVPAILKHVAHVIQPCLMAQFKKEAEEKEKNECG